MLKVGDKVMTLSDSSGTITKIEDNHTLVDLDLEHNTVKRFPLEELKSWHRTKEYMQMRYISDLHISLYSKDGTPKILDGVDAKTGKSFIKEAEKRIFGEKLTKENWKP